jgi:hypothetical protein
MVRGEEVSGAGKHEFIVYSVGDFLKGELMPFLLFITLCASLPGIAVPGGQRVQYGSTLAPPGVCL